MKQLLSGASPVRWFAAIAKKEKSQVQYKLNKDG